MDKMLYYAYLAHLEADNVSDETGNVFRPVIEMFKAVNRELADDLIDKLFDAVIDYREKVAVDAIKFAISVEAGAENQP